MPVNTTLSPGLAPSMQTFYDKTLLKNVKANLVHNQFGQVRNIPKNGGKTIQFRKYVPFAKATTPLTEGVTPEGSKLVMEEKFASVKQYGDFVALSDVLTMTAIDRHIVEAQKAQSVQSAETLDTITANYLNSGTNVYYCGEKLSRSELTPTCVLTVKDVRKIVRCLKQNKARKINGTYIAIAHPYVLYDLKNDTEWQNVKTYADPKDWYNGEVGKIEGVRFLETTEAVMFVGEGKDKCNVFSTLFFGEDAYGRTSVEGGGLKTIVHPAGSGGTADPLDQRSTVGWKAIHTACILQDAFLVRCESSATDEDDFDVSDTGENTDSGNQSGGETTDTSTTGTESGGVTKAEDGDL